VWPMLPVANFPRRPASSVVILSSRVLLKRVAVVAPAALVMVGLARSLPSQLLRTPPATQPVMALLKSASARTVAKVSRSLAEVQGWAKLLFASGAAGIGSKADGVTFGRPAVSV
jgi:hypothetical protein